MRIPTIRESITAYALVLAVFPAFLSATVIADTVLVTAKVGRYIESEKVISLRDGPRVEQRLYIASVAIEMPERLKGELLDVRSYDEISAGHLLRTEGAMIEFEVDETFLAHLKATPPYDHRFLSLRDLKDIKKAAEPGATDNPDDARRLREDH